MNLAVTHFVTNSNDAEQFELPGSGVSGQFVQSLFCQDSKVLLHFRTYYWVLSFCTQRQEKEEEVQHIKRSSSCAGMTVTPCQFLSKVIVAVDETSLTETSRLCQSRRGIS